MSKLHRQLAAFDEPYMLNLCWPIIYQARVLKGAVDENGEEVWHDDYKVISPFTQF